MRTDIITIRLLRAILVTELNQYNDTVMSDKEFDEIRDLLQITENVK